MKIQQDFSIKELNTFRIDVKAKEFIEITSINELKELITEGHLKDKKYFILGGGSNTLFTQDFDGIVIKISIKGLDVNEDAETYAVYNVAAGENWDEVVEFFTEKNLGGLENLSLIPGEVGAAPIGNIGAYGAEVKNTILYVDTIEIETGMEKRFLNEECLFNYRDSIFKNELKDKYIIVNVGFKLIKDPTINTNYAELEKELETFRDMSKELTIKDIRQAVIQIRTRKLPNVKEVGTAGSFFKNPIVSKKKFAQLKKKYKEIPSYPVDETTIKVPAGWLIEQAGWKGWKSKNKRYGIHKEHALIPINFNSARGEEILELTQDIKKSVDKKFGVTLIEEVNIIPQYIQ